MTRRWSKLGSLVGLLVLACLPALAGPTFAAESVSTVAFSGTVTDTLGHPLEGVRVVVLETGSAWSADLEGGDVVTTDSEGHFSGVTLAGITTFEFRSEDPNLAATFLGGTANKWHARWLTTAQQLSGIHMVMPPAGSISGHVSVPATGSLPDQSAVWLLVNNSVGNWVHVDDDSFSPTPIPSGGFDYSFTQLPPGDYAVGLPLGGVKPVTLAAGQSVTGADLQIARRTTVTGTVTLPDGSPAGDVGVKVGTDERPDGANPETTTASDGSFSITKTLLPGNYWVTTEPNDYTVASPSLSQALTVSADSDPAPVAMTLRTPATMSGTLLLPSGAAASHYFIYLGQRANTYTSSTGKFKLSGIVPGPTKIAFTDDRYRNPLLGVSDGTMQIAEGQHITGVRLHLRREWVSIGGTLTGGSSQIQIFKVHLGQVAKQPLVQSYSNMDHFRYILPPGNYAVHFAGDYSPNWHGWFGTSGNSAHTTIIRLPNPGDQKWRVTNAYRRHAVVRGTVNFANGERFFSGEVYAYEAGTGALVERGLAVNSAFRVTGLPPGYYKFKFVQGTEPLATSVPLGGNWWPDTDHPVTWWFGNSSTRAGAKAVKVGTSSVSLGNTLVPTPSSTD